MTVRTTFQGAYEISQRKNKQVFKRQYLGFTKKEAKSLFREQFKNFNPDASA